MVGYGEAQDLQDLTSVNKVQRSWRYIDEDGKRQDSAHTFLHPRLQDGQHNNLIVITEHEVKKVNLQSKKAVSVTIQGTPGFQDPSSTYTIKAKKRIVLSSGNLGTPLILERSGVGDPNILTSKGISVNHALNGVGKNYQDHNLIMTSYYSSLQSNETYNGILRGTESYDDLLATNSPKLGWTAMEVTSKLRPKQAEIDALGTSFKAAWNRDFKNKPTKPMATVATVSG
jgi:choline dehydrogenase-like flavoprotein